MERPRLVYVVTVPATARLLLRGQLRYMRECGYDVTVVSGGGADLDVVATRECVDVVPLPMLREIAPAADARALARLTAVLRKLRPHIVNASTPKAGLLGMLAARAVGVPLRYYLLRGLRSETTRGSLRLLLESTERVASACATNIVSVSPTLRDTYIARGLAPAKKVVVLGSGSSNGVSLDRFARTAERQLRAGRIRESLGISRDGTVLGFVGRPVAEKGIDELLTAFERLANQGVYLILLGAGLAGDELPAGIRQRLERLQRVVSIPTVDDPADYYSVFDVLAFPSMREGFPNAPLEAGAASIPTVGFRVTGVRDAVVDGETGTLVSQGDVDAFHAALLRYVTDPELRARHGAKARERVSSEFDPQHVWRLWASEYSRASEERGVPMAQPASTSWTAATSDRYG